MKGGFGYLELLVGVAIVALCLGPMIAASTGSIRGTDHSARRIIAITLTNALMERHGSLPFDTLKKRFEGGGSASLDGLVRTADLSGIPLDDTTLHGSAEFRDKLGLNDFGGAANSELDRADPKLAPRRFFEPSST